MGVDMLSGGDGAAGDTYRLTQAKDLFTHSYRAQGYLVTGRYVAQNYAVTQWGERLPGLEGDKRNRDLIALGEPY